jgi:cyclopropane-fatty-acyl-phospholipid synthase
LGSIVGGSLTMRYAGAEETFGSAEDLEDIAASIEVRDPRFFRRAVFGGSIGAGESYMDGEWGSDDLVAVIRLMARNDAVLSGLERGWGGGLSRLAAKVLHALNRNTLAGSRRNIAAHYDLGNDFYRLMLDDTMAYSSGIFETPEATLEQASDAKFDRMCRKLCLAPDDHVLEIGSGWGGFALHAAGRYGCRVTTTTISREQHAETVGRVRRAGLADRVEVLLRDYRELAGSFDKVVSIEMIEAVGHRYLDTFFRVVSERLKPDGMAALQAITVPDQVYRRHVRDVDFIKKHIFPGSSIPSIAAMLESVARATDLRLVHLEDITRHYARTLRVWRERFLGNVERVRALGFSDSFVRMWEFYLAYCEGSFEERYNGDVQLVFSKPRCRRGMCGPPPACGIAPLGERQRS